MNTQQRSTAIMILVLLAIILLTFCTVRQAAAHHAPTGWAYSVQCCSGRDCAMETEEVLATELGWLVTSTGETVPYTDKRVRESQDGDFHRCQVPGIATLRCLYVPPMGF